MTRIYKEVSIWLIEKIGGSMFIQWWKSCNNQIGNEWACLIQVRAVHRKPVPDPLAKTVRSGVSTGRPDAGDGRRQVSASRTRNQRVGWRVFPPKIRKTRTDWWKSIIRWETQIPREQNPDSGVIW